LDLFALAVSLYQLLTWRAPFAEASEDDPLYMELQEDPGFFLQKTLPLTFKDKDDYRNNDLQESFLLLI